MACRWRNPLAQVKPGTIGIVSLTALWVAFQVRDPTPPPILDQVLVASYGIWFTNEAIDKRKKSGRRKNDDDSD